MKLIDSEKLLESMSARYDEKKNIVPDNLAEGFMQMDKLICEQDIFDLEAHNKQIRADAIDDFQEWLKSQIVVIDNKTKEILVVKDDRWELAIDVFRKGEKKK